MSERIGAVQLRAAKNLQEELSRLRELVKEMREIDWGRVTDAVEYHYDGCDQDENDINLAISSQLTALIAKADAILGESAK